MKKPEVMSKFIGYYRVSTKEQGISGLGLQSQMDAVSKYVTSVAGVMLSEYTDIESGTKRERVNLMSAIRQAHQSGAILVVKKLDRLSRGGYQIMNELDVLGVSFIESDSPFDSTLMKEFKLSMARDEARKISERTVSALGVIKNQIADRGVYISKSGNAINALGKPSNLNAKSVENSVSSRKASALNNPANTRAYALINALRYAGMSWYRITIRLNEAGYLTSRGNNFSEAAVIKLFNLFKK